MAAVESPGSASLILRRLAALGVLVLGALASAATSPGQPAIRHSLSGHAAMPPGGMVTHELEIRVDPRASADVARINVRFTAGRRPRGPGEELIDVRIRGPGLAVDEGPWELASGDWSIDAPGCIAQQECVLRYQLEIRRTAGTDHLLLVAWRAHVGVGFDNRARDLRYDWVTVSTVAGTGGDQLMPWSVAGLLAGLASAVVFLMMATRAYSSLSAVRGVEVLGGAALAMAGAWTLVLTIPGVGASGLPVLLFLGAAFVLVVAWLRPPGPSPRATTTAAALVLLPMALSAHRTAPAVDPIDVLLTFTALGVLTVAGVGGLVTPAAWWRRLILEPRAAPVTTVTASLLALLAGSAVVGAVGHDWSVAPFVGLAAIVSVWVLLAFREWTESRTRVLRSSALAVALGAIVVSLGTTFSLSDLVGGSIPPEPRPLTPFIGVFVAVLAGVLAKMAAPQSRASTSIDAVSVMAEPTPSPSRSMDRRALLRATGLRAAVVLAAGLLLAVLLLCWSALMAAGITAYPSAFSVVPLLIALILLLGLWRWSAGASGLLRSGSAAGTVYVVLTLLTHGYRSDSPLWDWQVIVQLAMLAALISAFVLFALSSPPRPRRDGIDWTA